MEAKELARQLRKAGKKYKDIAEETGLSIDWCKKNLSKVMDKKSTTEDAIFSLLDLCNSPEGCTSVQATVELRRKLGALTKDRIKYIKKLALSCGVVFKEDICELVARYNPSNNYVYSDELDGETLYIGKGTGNRWVHCVSGVSHVYELNRAHFSGKLVEVYCLVDGLNSDEAFAQEATIIMNLKPRFNTKMGQAVATSTQINKRLIYRKEV